MLRITINAHYYYYQDIHNAIITLTLRHEVAIQFTTWHCHGQYTLIQLHNTHTTLITNTPRHEVAIQFTPWYRHGFIIITAIQYINLINYNCFSYQLFFEIMI